MYYVYALYNSKSDKIYIGQTKDLDNRLSMHNKKFFENSYTARFVGEWELVYKEKCPDRKSALVREKQLKSFRGREFVRKNMPR